MYSYEDRIRAVKLFIKLGKRTAATIRQLGYPTKRSLRNWHLEYERRRDLPAGYVRSKPKYSQQQKRLAIDHYLAHGRCIAATAKALGYPGRGTLAAWICELHPESKQRVVGNAAGEPRTPELKRAAVLELCTRPGSAQAVAQKLGVSRPTLYNWKNKLAGTGGARIHEAPQGFATRPAGRAGGAGAPSRIASSRHSATAARTRPLEEG